MATKKIKTEAVSVPVPQSREEVSNAIAEIGAAQRERARIEADMNDALAKIKKQFEEAAEPHKLKIEQLTKGVHTWCEANRLDLTNGGKVKFAKLSSGEVKWRLRPTKVTIRGVENLLEIMKGMGLYRFIRSKEEPNKEQMLAEPEVVAGLPGVKFEKGEDFVIVPFETALEEVA